CIALRANTHTPLTPDPSSRSTGARGPNRTPSPGLGIELPRSPSGQACMMRLRTNAAVAGLGACGLIACAALGTWRALADLPPIRAPPPDLSYNDPRVTWLGYGVAAAYGLGLLLVVIIYVGKRWVIRFTTGAPARVLWYCLGVACSLPYI